MTTTFFDPQDEPHDSFAVTITCIDCGWSWSGWGHDEATEAMNDHIKATTNE